MRKYVIVLLALCLLTSINVSAQAFQKGSVNFDLGFGLGGYSTDQTHTGSVSATVGVFPFVFPFSLDTSFSSSDGAVVKLFPFSFEYGISDKVGLGIDFTYNNYVVEIEGQSFTANVKSFDFGLKGYYHIVNSDKFDLSVGLGFGISSIKFNVHGYTDQINVNLYTIDFEIDETTGKGNGKYINLAFKGKYWLSKSIGIFGEVGYKGYSYSSVDTDTSGEEADLESNPFVSEVSIKDEFTFKMNGVDLGLGLAFKF